jgi:ankyrin repeat protein
VLVNKGAGVDISYGSGETALHRAVKSGDEGLMKLLIEFGVHFTVYTDYSLTITVNVKAMCACHFPDCDAWKNGIATCTSSMGDGRPNQRCKELKIKQIGLDLTVIVHITEFRRAVPSRARH